MSREAPALRLPEVGDRLGDRYRIDAWIGRGAMGEVFAATDLRLERGVAVKVPRMAGEPLTTAALERFRREALATARLGHPNIVEVRDFAIGEPPFLVMERLTGESLEARIQREGALDPGLSIRVAQQVLSALEAAHDAGILHRDIKPGNVHLTELSSGELLVKVLDFGLAYLLEEPSSTKLTVTGTTVGTPAFMAPERLYGEPVDERSDLYSVGVCMYLSLHGVLPGSRGPAVEVDAALEAIVARAIAEAPADRFANAAEMVAALDAWTPGQPGVGILVPAPRARPRRGSGLAMFSTTAGLVLLVALFLGWRLWPNAEAQVEAEIEPPIAAAPAPPEPAPARIVEAAPSTPTAVDTPEPPPPERAIEAPAAGELVRRDDEDRPATPARARRPRPARPAPTPALTRESAALSEGPIEPDWSQARSRP
ncbi:MAG: serine/threonine protein kinase [Myxococcales bacterium]|nr:serine/threonine protein kinase [Myxococcales bacterium]